MARGQDRSCLSRIQLIGVVHHVVTFIVWQVDHEIAQLLANIFGSLEGEVIKEVVPTDHRGDELLVLDDLLECFLKLEQGLHPSGELTGGVCETVSDLEGILAFELASPVLFFDGEHKGVKALHARGRRV